MSGNIWKKKKTYQLIKLWESHPELWNSSLKEYRDRQQKVQAIDEMARYLDVDKNEVNRKLHNLRCQMNTEIRKLKRKMNDDECEDKRSTWEFFGALKFMWGLADCSENYAQPDDCRVNELPPSHQGERLQNEHVIAAPSMTHQSEKKLVMKHKLGNTSDNLPKRGPTALFLQSTPTDEWAIFGEFVAAEMRQIRSEERRKRLKRTIQELIISVGEEEDYERFQSFHSAAEAPVTDSSNVIVTYYRNSDEHTSILP